MKPYSSRDHALGRMIGCALLGFGIILELSDHPRLAYAALILVFAIVLSMLRDLTLKGDR
ncbi:hypothetical protein [Sphingomonas sp. BK580]|uniref:hypothetical protein n=1 Tax=Sphingomonas sp. BK580 TaxID=2586972 RepID=UPI001616D68F|nr:hypothetical protein [Sphingomonas sp. BK580]MBB3691480.1 hypothetical protein [Sphingomonas sp. BK580]